MADKPDYNSDVGKAFLSLAPEYDFSSYDGIKLLRRVADYYDSNTSYAEVDELYDMCDNMSIEFPMRLFKNTIDEMALEGIDSIYPGTYTDIRCWYLWKKRDLKEKSSGSKTKAAC